MFIVMKRKTAGVILASIFFFGITLGAYNLSLHPNMHNWEKQGLLIREVNTDKKAVALTFDDGPDPANTPALLEVLDKHGAQATFFVVGSRAEEYPDLLKQMDQSGHEIGNHSYNHADYNGKSDEFIRDEIIKGSKTIKSITGNAPTFFRPPGGYLSYAMVDIVQEEGLIIAYWTWQQDSKDWQAGTSSARIADHIRDNIEPGQIIVLHDGAANGMQTVKAMDIVIPALKKDGYQFVTLSRLLELENNE